ncbi:UDP-N-acetylglucosamine 2-epimerase [Natrialbaceae archaeon A-arb3/5]
MNNIGVLTGTRAEYGLLKYTMDAVKKSNDLQLKTLVTGMHLSPKYGNTVNEISSDGFEVDKQVHMHFDGDSEVSTAKSVGAGITGISQALDSLKIDVLLVLGDRVEALAGGIAASTMNIPVAHIAGGSIRGGGMIDESIRHALTRFAHLHFVQTKSDEQTLEAVGEEKDRINLVGAPALDKIDRGDFSDGKKVLRSLSLNPSEPVIVVLQHPITTEPELAGNQMEETLSAVSQFDAQTVIIHPNSDPGRDEIVNQIKNFTNNNSDSCGIKNLPRSDYLGLLHVADLLIGNSSSGIIEAPCFELPTIDLGSRQGQRDRPNTVSRCPHDQKKIRDEIQNCLKSSQNEREINCSQSPYYYGGAADLIVDTLSSLKFDQSLLDKKIDIQS